MLLEVHINDRGQNPIGDIFYTHILKASLSLPTSLLTNIKKKACGLDVTKP